MEKWYVMYTKPQKEAMVNRQLEDRGIETYFPFLQYNRGYNRGIRIEPFFPHYLFLYVDLQSRTAKDLNWLPGIRSILYIDNQPATVPDPVIAALRNRLQPYSAKVLNKAEALFQPGQKVQVISGPFEGIETIFQKHLSSHDRVQVLLKLLGTWTRVEMNVSQIKPSSVSNKLPMVA